MELNLLLRGQSNALFFDYFGAYQTVQADVDKLLGFDGVTNKVNLLGGEMPDTEGNVTAVAGTGLLPPSADPWLNPINGDYTQGFTPGDHEQSLLNYIADLPADERAAPTAVIWMHNENDGAAIGQETTAEWTAAVRYDAGLVRQAFGQTAATVPYLFVPIPFDQDGAAAQQAIRLGQEQLAADPIFDALVATHTGDLDMNNPVNGLSSGDVIYGGPHITPQDAQILAARIAPAVADTFAQYALPGSPIALAGGHVDDTGPQAVRVDWRPAQPTQVIVTLQNDPSALGLEPLGTEAAAGLGWTIRDNGDSISATSAQELPGNQVLLTFSATVPTDSAALLFYNYGTGRVAVGSDTHTGAGYPGTGPGSPGEGNSLYDDEGLPVWSSAAGVDIDTAPVATVVASTGISSGLTLYEGDTLGVLAGGTAQGTTVFTGATDSIASGGTASGTVLDGGSLMVAGSASGSIVAAGSETVLSGGTESGGTVASGGMLHILGGTASGEAVGGDVTVGPGGVLDMASLAGGGTVTVDDGGMLTGSFQDGGDLVFAIAGSLVTGASIFGSGSLSVSGGGTLTLAAASALTGTITVDGSTLVLAPASGAASVVLSAGATLVVAAGASDTVTGVAPGDGQTVEVTGLATLPTVTHAGDQVELTAGSVVTDFDLVGSADTGITVTETTLLGDGMGYSVSVSEGTTPCYCDGTLILTDRGEVAVERLAIGDRVVTAAGPTETIRWIGRRSFTGRLLQGQPGLLPVRFRAGSLGDGVPRRDLLVSPDHAMFLDGVLVPARCLLNGRTITQERHCSRVSYVHVELARHDVILAEGAPSETFLDDDSRGMFHNASEFAAMYPGLPGDGMFCAPRVTHGYGLDAIRQRLAIVAGGLAMEAA